MDDCRFVNRPFAGIENRAEERSKNSLRVSCVRMLQDPLDF
jgi:hypothetical protein